jgi:hypothetical protein
MRNFALCAVMLALVVGAAPVAGQTLLWEDFDDGVANSFTVQSGNWEVVSGSYHVRNDGFEIYVASLAGDTNWNDYSFECDLKAVGSINQHVRFRVQDDLNYYEINMRAAPYNDAHLQKVVNGYRSTLSTASFANVNNVWHHFAVSLSGPEIQFACDGTPLIQYTDGATPFMNGGIALASYSGGVVQWQDMYFDNVLVHTQAVPATSAAWGEVKALFR